MENEELEPDPETVTPKPISWISTTSVFIAIIVMMIIVAVLAYREGCKDTKRIYEEPSLLVTLIPEMGTVTVIPVKLTNKGIGIRFNSPLTNIIALGIDYHNKK